MIVLLFSILLMHDIEIFRKLPKCIICILIYIFDQIKQVHWIYTLVIFQPVSKIVICHLTDLSKAFIKIFPLYHTCCKSFIPILSSGHSRFPGHQCVYFVECAAQRMQLPFLIQFLQIISIQSICKAPSLPWIINLLSVFLVANTFINPLSPLFM